jgi:hypothetical protein
LANWSNRKRVIGKRRLKAKISVHDKGDLGKFVPNRATTKTCENFATLLINSYLST